MDNSFSVERVALHRMDKASNMLEKAKHEVDMTTFTEQSDIDAINGFFSDHLRRIWEAPEGSSRVSAAQFRKAGSEIQKDYDGLVVNSDQFLACSQRMADSLFGVAPMNSSAGILMTLWCRVSGDSRPFLALLKMDPERSDKVSLRLRGDEILLELAVQHIDQALPDTGERVLKWAVTPHPTRPYDVKIKDNQGKPETALYFMKFLGCEEQKPEKQQVVELFQALPANAIEKLTQETANLPGVDIKAIRQSNALTTSQKEKVETRVGKEFSVHPKSIQNAKLGYKLSNKIVIKGPWAAMKGIKIQRLGNDYEFRVRANDYEEVYE